MLLNVDKSGKIFETFVCIQIIAQVEAGDNEYERYHYRDREKREIDFILQDTNDNIFGIEVKAGSSVTKDRFKHLTWFKNNLAKNKNFTGFFYIQENRLFRLEKTYLLFP